MRVRRLGLVLHVDRFMEARHTKDVPKHLRPHPGPIGEGEGVRALGHVRPLVDPMRTLGHAPRPRKRRR